MDKLEIIIKCVGDGISAISECHKIVVAYGKPLYLSFPQGFSIKVSPTSEIQDLFEILNLECQIKNMAKTANKVA